MKLLLIGHEDRYAVEQLQLALFPLEPMEPVEEAFDGDGAVSTLHRGATWLTATTKITRGGKSTSVSKRLRASEETVRLRRRILQQSYYLPSGKGSRLGCPLRRPAHQDHHEAPAGRRQRRQR